MGGNSFIKPKFTIIDRRIEKLLEAGEIQTKGERDAMTREERLKREERRIRRAEMAQEERKQKQESDAIILSGRG